MNKLVVHHAYVNGMAFDTSNNRNHGVPYAVSQAAAPHAPAFEFATGASRVVVPPSTSLQDLLAVRAVVTFYLAPAGGISRRYNIIEGHLSFALFVQPDGSLMGTIRDETGSWFGATSSPSVVSTGRWHQAEIRHDGMNQCLIFLDGVGVGSSYAARGPVASVGPHGIAIGHWPESSGVYTFEGYIRETWVYKYDPLLAAKGLLDCCCLDRRALDDTADALRKKGYTAQKAHDQGMKLIKFGLAISARVRGNDAARSQEHAVLSAQALAAFQRGDSAAYTNALTELAHLAVNSLSATEQQEIHDTEEGLFKQLPLSLKEWLALLAKLCWDRAKLDPRQLLSTFEIFPAAAEKKAVGKRRKHHA